MTTRAGLLAIVTCLVLATVAGAQLNGAYTIDPNGTGPTNYVSFSAAAQALSAGVSGPVVFQVTPTTYQETPVFNPANGASATNTISFVAAGGTAVIDANSGQDGLTLNAACSYFVFDGIEVKNATRYTLHLAGPSTTKATFNTFQNCKFDAPASTSSSVRSAFLNYPTDCTFTNCIFAGGGWAFYTQQINRCVFQGCEFDGKGQAAYLIAPFNSNDADNLWENCFFHDCGPTGRGLYFNWSCYGNAFFHNVILMNTSNEAVFLGSCCAWTRCQAWRNNIIANLGTGPCTILGYEDTTFGGGPGLDYNDLDHNCYYHPNGTNTIQLETNSQGFNFVGPLSAWKTFFQANLGKTAWVVPGGGTTFDDNSIEADPQLVSMTAPYDIHLKGSSPCLDAGTTTYIAGAWVTGLPANYVTAIDFEGEARPATKVDIGADEISVRLVGSGSGQPGTTITFSLLGAPDAGLPYQMGSSFGAGPIPIDTRQLGLSNLLVVSVGGYLPTIFQNYAGLLDAQGAATAYLNIPNIAVLKGIRIHTAFVSLKPTAPSGVSNISNTFVFTIL